MVSIDIDLGQTIDEEHIVDLKKDRASARARRVGIIKYIIEIHFD
jgi:hypothetical protein